MSNYKEVATRKNMILLECARMQFEAYHNGRVRDGSLQEDVVGYIEHAFIQGYMFGMEQAGKPVDEGSLIWPTPEEDDNE